MIMIDECGDDCGGKFGTLFWIVCFQIVLHHPANSIERTIIVIICNQI